MKLGERYSELYDNEWTDAFEVLTSDLQYDDKAAIQKLIELLNVSERMTNDCSPLTKYVLYV